MAAFVIRGFKAAVSDGDACSGIAAACDPSPGESFSRRAVTPLGRAARRICLRRGLDEPDSKFRLTVSGSRRLCFGWEPGVGFGESETRSGVDAHPPDLWPGAAVDESAQGGFFELTPGHSGPQGPDQGLHGRDRRTRYAEFVSVPVARSSPLKLSDGGR